MAAAIQMRSGLLIASNIKEVEALIRQAAAQGANYIQTPEMTNLVDRCAERLRIKLSAQNSQEIIKYFACLAKELSIWLHIGSIAIENSPQDITNRALLYSPRGELVAYYDKIHMFDVDLSNGENWRESDIYQPGSIARVYPLPWLRVGFGICYDIRFPCFYRALSLAGAGLLTAPAAFTRKTGHAHWHVLLRARAIENGAWIVAAAQGGRHEDGRETYGHSVIIDPWGTIIAEKDDIEPGIIMAKINAHMVMDVRAQIPSLSHDSPFDLVSDGIKVT